MLQSDGESGGKLMKYYFGGNPPCGGVWSLQALRTQAVASRVSYISHDLNTQPANILRTDILKQFSGSKHCTT
jgi:hypothetical protein